jgi:hypothetical protein
MPPKQKQPTTRSSLLQSKKVSELRVLAKAHGVSLQGLRTKEEIVSKLYKNRKMTKKVITGGRTINSRDIRGGVHTYTDPEIFRTFIKSNIPNSRGDVVDEMMDMQYNYMFMKVNEKKQVYFEGKKIGEETYSTLEQFYDKALSNIRALAAEEARAAEAAAEAAEEARAKARAAAEEARAEEARAKARAAAEEARTRAPKYTFTLDDDNSKYVYSVNDKKVSFFFKFKKVLIKKFFDNIQEGLFQETEEGGNKMIHLPLLESDTSTELISHIVYLKGIFPEKKSSAPAEGGRRSRRK